MLFPAFQEPRNQFPRQGWSSPKFFLKSKIFNENGQLAGGGGVARDRQFYFFYFIFFFVCLEIQYVNSFYFKVQKL